MDVSTHRVNKNRPGKKGYDKLAVQDKEINKNSHKHHSTEELDDCLNNITSGCKNGCPGNGCQGNNGNNINGNSSNGILDSDNESTFTDVDYDENEGFSDDDSDYEEALTCNVCDRTFSCPKQLSAHKQKKRHFGCSACDSLFPSLMALEHHKEEFEHWSDDEEICSESDNEQDTVISEECERLL